ncbi:MAG: hypothetical protein JHC32_00045 [Candidatus Aminicenantes bacterium]|nr:hypothetical protein [Candidatus Aminicenantes bacterium]
MLGDILLQVRELRFRVNLIELSESEETAERELESWEKAQAKRQKFELRIRKREKLGEISLSKIF